MSFEQAWEAEIEEFARNIFCFLVAVGATRTPLSVKQISTNTGEAEDQVELALSQLIACKIPLVEQVDNNYKVKAVAVNQAKKWQKAKALIIPEIPLQSQIRTDHTNKIYRIHAVNELNHKVICELR